MHCTDLNNDTLKILAAHFSYNEKLKEEYSASIANVENEKPCTRRENRYLSKITAICNVVFQSLIATVPKHIVNELEIIQKSFIWESSTLKIKHETLCNDYKAEELKYVDIPNKIIALQRSWIRILYDNSFHEWKLIPLFKFTR